MNSATPKGVVNARAVAWIGDDPFPGVIQVELTDGDGVVWTFQDKVPIFDAKDVLRSDSQYPLDLELACTMLRREGFADEERLIISTAEPWGIETKEGQYEFAMRPAQVRRP